MVFFYIMLKFLAMKFLKMIFEIINMLFIWPFRMFSVVKFAAKVNIIMSKHTKIGEKQLLESVQNKLVRRVPTILG